MIHSEKEVLDWLLAHCEHDRVLYNALTNHQEEPAITWIAERGRWDVVAIMPLTKRIIDIIIIPNTVTGEPNRYYYSRVNEHADA